MKTDGALADIRASRRGSCSRVIVLMGAVSLATPFVDPRIAARWFSWPNIA